MTETERPIKELKEITDTIRDATPKSVQVCCCALPAFIILCVVVPVTIFLFRWALS